MSEHILRILLSELQTVRIVCKNCGTIVEVPLEKLEEKFKENACLSCKRVFHNLNTATDKVKTLGQLADVMQRLIALDTVAVEFILPQKD